PRLWPTPSSPTPSLSSALTIPLTSSASTVLLASSVRSVWLSPTRQPLAVRLVQTTRLALSLVCRFTQPCLPWFGQQSVRPSPSTSPRPSTVCVSPNRWNAKAWTSASTASALTTTKVNQFGGTHILTPSSRHPLFDLRTQPQRPELSAPAFSCSLNHIGCGLFDTGRAE